MTLCGSAAIPENSLAQTGLAEGVISFVLAIQVGVSPYSLATVSLYLLALGDRTRNKLVINKLTGLE